LRKKVTVF